MTKLMATHIIRVAGVLIENKQLLIIEQNIGNKKWFLPGGKVESGETLEAAIIREMREETGLTVEIERLLCISDTDFFSPNAIHIMFLLKKVGGNVRVPYDLYDTVPITNVKFVPINMLCNWGFSEKFTQYCMSDFDNIPSYVGKDTYFDLVLVRK